ncbi:MAG TPA: YggT family protein [Ktedonobacteraceae bacterium]|nr:YggT family protein [Ktedonobacteraceae bacterium]
MMINQPDPRIAEDAQSRERVNPGGEDATVRSTTTSGSSGESRQTTYVDPAGNQVENRVEVYQDKNLSRENRRSWVVNMLSFLFGVLEVLLVLRFFFRLLGASQDNSFTQFLYNLSQVFVAPFNGIFHDQILGTRSVFELSTLVAMLVYALLTWGLVALSRVIFAPHESGRQRFTTTRLRQR